MDITQNLSSKVIMKYIDVITRHNTIQTVEASTLLWNQVKANCKHHARVFAAQAEEAVVVSGTLLELPDRSNHLVALGNIPFSCFQETLQSFSWMSLMNILWIKNKLFFIFRSELYGTVFCIRVTTYSMKKSRIPLRWFLISIGLIT